MTEPEQPLRLTFAELEYLLARSESWPASRRVLGLAAPTTAGVAAAGLASLAVRELASQPGDNVTIDDDVRAAAATIDQMAWWLEFDFRSQDVLFASYLGVSSSGDARVLVTTVGPGCYEVAALRVTDPVSVQACDVAMGLLADVSPSLLMVRHGGSVSDVVTVGRDAAGGWRRFEGGPADPQPSVVTEQEARALCEGVLAAAVV